MRLQENIWWAPCDKEGISQIKARLKQAAAWLVSDPVTSERCCQISSANAPATPRVMESLGEILLHSDENSNVLRRLEI